MPRLSSVYGVWSRYSGVLFQFPRKIESIPRTAVTTLRLHLPPNLAAAAARDAVALRIDLPGGVEPEPGLAPVLALLRRWCGTPSPPPFIQITRRQLRELADAAAGLPIFVENAVSAPWGHDELLQAPEGLPAPGRAAGVAPRRAPRPAEPPEPLVVDGSEHYLAVSLPSREDTRHGRALELVRAAGFVLEPSNRKWWLRDRHKTLCFLAAHGDLLRGELGARFTPNFTARTSHLAAAEITCDASPSGDGWDVALGLRGGASGDDALRDAVAAGRPYVETGRQIVLIDPARVRRLGQAQRALADGGPSAATA